MLTDWRQATREGLISSRLAAALAVVECLTSGRVADLPAAIDNATKASVEPHALRSAAYVNFGFNVINRVADALGVALPEAPDLHKSSRLLLSVGYRPLSGTLFATDRHAWRRSPGEVVDLLNTTAVRGPGQLSSAVRLGLFDGIGTGDLAQFGRTVADCAWTVRADAVEKLKRAGYLEDEIFEAVICAALGAASRLSRALFDLLSHNAPPAPPQAAV